MSDQLYRIDYTVDKSEGAWVRAHEHALVSTGMLVPAEPCEHGNYARHIIEETVKVYSRGPDWEWCDGGLHE